MVGVVVSEMSRSIDFYRRLGLEFPSGAEGEGHVEATNAGLVRFALDTEEVVRSFDPEWRRPDHGHHAGAFLCDGPEEVDRLHGELVRDGYGSHKEPWDAFWGQRYAQLKDPDGNAIDLFAQLP